MDVAATAAVARHSGFVAGDADTDEDVLLREGA
jgi:hypothetical protein